MSELLREPDAIEVADIEISNFDHSVPDEAERVLRGGKAIEHPAWDHWGLIWFSGGQFHERVMRYNAHVATISADSLADLLEEVNDRFGYA